MPATAQTIRMIRAALTADSGVTDEEASAVARLLEGRSPTTGTAQPDELLDEKAVQGILKLSHQTLWRLERSGELVAHRIGRTRRYSRLQVEDYIRGLVDECLQPQGEAMGGTTKIDWSRADWRLQDITLAAEFGCTREAARQARSRLGKPMSATYRKKTIVTAAARLGAMDTSSRTLPELAVETGCCVHYVSVTLRNLGKEFRKMPPGNSKYDWSRIPADWRTMSDKELAALVGGDGPAIIIQWRLRNGHRRRPIRNEAQESSAVTNTPEGVRSTSCFKVHSKPANRIIQASAREGEPMASFLEAEKQQQAKFKREAKFFSEPARGNGEYKGAVRAFCLPIDHAEENLIPEARKAAVDWLDWRDIKWHDGKDGNPSNHLCDSQVCCVNFLFPFAGRPEPLASLLRPVFPGLKRMLPIEDGKFVTFEWIGKENYLGEKMRPGSQRTRGANFTSADAAVMFEREDGKKQVVLVEWKYTESYGGTSLKIAASGTDRTAIYQHLYAKADCPLDKSLIPSFESLFFEPFYQLMRQQFLANEMENARELDADIVSLLHIAPAHNEAFRKVTSKQLERLGDSATDVWKRLVKTDKFQSVSTEELFGPLLKEPPAGMEPWADYLTQRYRWLVVTDAASTMLERRSS